MREGARLPVRAHKTDAGIDLYYCPKGDRANNIQEEGLAIHARESVLIPTGIRVEIPYGYMLEIKNKSGIAFKRQLIVGACVVDSGYDGEIFVNLHNIGLGTQLLRAGEKVAQAIMIPIVHCKIEEVDTDQFLNFHSSRGKGGFGSTGEE